jgi:hypothetical protein
VLRTCDETIKTFMILFEHHLLKTIACCGADKLHCPQPDFNNGMMVGVSENHHIDS